MQCPHFLSLQNYPWPPGKGSRGLHPALSRRSNRCRERGSPSPSPQLYSRGTHPNVWASEVGGVGTAPRGAHNMPTPSRESSSTRPSRSNSPSRG